MRTKSEWVQKNKIKIVSGTLLFCILLLYANPLLFGFPVKWVFVSIHCILIFIIPMVSIFLLNSLNFQKGLIISIIISVFFLPYFYFSDKIIEYEKLVFFRSYQSELSKVSLEILNNTGDFELISGKLNDLGIEDVQRDKENVIFKLSDGKYMFNGFIYAHERLLPDSAFGIKINETEKIEGDWYSYSCDSLDLN